MVKVTGFENNPIQKLRGEFVLSSQLTGCGKINLSLPTSTPPASLPPWLAYSWYTGPPPVHTSPSPGNTNPGQELPLDVWVITSSGRHRACCISWHENYRLSETEKNSEITISLNGVHINATIPIANSTLKHAIPQAT